MFARLTLFTADPERLGEVISHAEHDVRMDLTHQQGSRGMAVLVNDELGVALVDDYWATEKEMRSNDTNFVRPAHDAAFFGATIAIEHYEVASFVHGAPARPGAAVSVTRFDTEPTHTDDVRAAYGRIALGPLAARDGFSTAVLLIDPQSGKAVIETIWRDGQALAAARGLAAARRLEAVSAETVIVRGLEQYRLDFHSADLD